MSSEDADSYLQEAKLALAEYKAHKKCIYCRDSADAALGLIDSLEQGKQDADAYNSVLEQKKAWDKVHEKTPELISNIKAQMVEEKYNTPEPAPQPEPVTMKPKMPTGFFSGGRLGNILSMQNSTHGMPMVIKQDGRQVQNFRHSIQKLRNSRPKISDMLEDVF